ncbi:MAG: Hint domain-containing protein, partial [Saprospiraceae bacterium]|nr:Hint domain-containing protein [Saprospiraceae bacterium]
MGALAGSYVLWYYIQKGDPQGMYGVDRDKRLTAIVFGGKKEQAKANQWMDINNVILGAPCYTNFISRPQTERLTIYSKQDFVNEYNRRERGIFTDQDFASFEIIPRESTVMAGRGPAAYMQFYDEAAHVVKGVANVPAEEVYEAATPALDQFGVDGFIYLPSSPWQRIGLFHDKYQQSIAHDEETGETLYPEMLMLQLTSWDIYKDWEDAHNIEMWPGGPNYQRLQNAIQTYDHQMQQLERANPETFRVERRCLDPETRILMADLTWREIGKLEPGDELIGFDERVMPDTHARRMRTASVVATSRSWDVAYRLTFDDGSSVVCSGNHRWLSTSGAHYGDGRSVMRWRPLYADPHSP